jgi:ribosomal protein S18 acetylase RimI-like enzyme
MPDQVFSIRSAMPADAKALAGVAEATFRETFGATNSARDMAEHCRQHFSEDIQKAEILDPGMVNLMYESGDEILGFAQLRWAEPPACVGAENAAEIQRLYVVRDAHGKGVAQALMNACLESLQQKGFTKVWLGVWEKNPRAISFYRKIGFIEVGEHIFQLGNDPQRDIIMARQLEPLPPSSTGAT